MGAFVNNLEAASPTGINEWGTMSAVLGVNGAADYLVPKYPIANTFVSDINTIITVTVIVYKLLYPGPAQKRLAVANGEPPKNVVKADGRAMGAFIKGMLCIPAMACAGWHLYEPSTRKAHTSNTRDAAVIGEVASRMARMLYAEAVNDPEPESKTVEIMAMAVANLCTASLQTAEAIVD